MTCYFSLSLFHLSLVFVWIVIKLWQKEAKNAFTTGLNVISFQTCFNYCNKKTKQQRSKWFQRNFSVLLPFPLRISLFIVVILFHFRSQKMCWMLGLWHCFGQLNITRVSITERSTNGAYIEQRQRQQHKKKSKQITIMWCVLMQYIAHFQLAVIGNVNQAHYKWNFIAMLKVH